MSEKDGIGALCFPFSADLRVGRCFGNPAEERSGKNGGTSHTMVLSVFSEKFENKFQH